MASYVFSANPNVAFDPTNGDVLVVDTVSASKLRVAQVGSNVVLTDGTHTAILRNFVLQQVDGNNITFTDGSLLAIGDENISVAGDVGDNFISTGDRGDQLIGLAGDDELDGGRGDDLIYGNQGNDIIGTAVDAGNDTVYGGQGDDVIIYAGGPGRAQLPADAASAAAGPGLLIYGNTGNDTIFAGEANDRLFGGQGNDSLITGNGDNYAHGGLGLDLLFGGEGNDTLYGGADEDSIIGAEGNNLIYGNQGDDNIVGTSASNDTVYGGQDADSIFYGLLSDCSTVLAYGNQGNDEIIGGAGNDTLFGGQGDDLLSGNYGKDFLTGGVGKDSFGFVAQANIIDSFSGVTTDTAHTIRDFATGQDKILTMLDTNGDSDPGDLVGVAGNGTNYREFADATISSVEKAAASYGSDSVLSQFTFIAGASDGYLVIDGDEDGTAESVIVLAGLKTLAGFDATDIAAGPFGELPF